MIPTIGVMIGCYIVVRMADLICLLDRNRTVKVLAVIAMMVAVISMVDLVKSGAPTPNFPR